MKNTTNRLLVVSSVCSVLLSLHAIGFAGEDGSFKFETEDKKFSLQLGSRVQFRFTQEDPEIGNSEGSFRIRRAKFSLSGKAYDYWKYKVQANWSGGSTSLEDAYLQYTRNLLAQPWMGQGKAFFGRQQLTSSGKQQFVDRSIASGRFSHGRDQGVGLVGQNEKRTFEYNAGIYNGNGRNQSSNDNGDYLLVGRLVWTPFGEFKLAESSLNDPESSRLAVGISTMSNAVVQTLTRTDMTTATFLEQEVQRTGLEIAYRIKSWNIVAEYFMETGDFVSIDSMDIITNAELDTDGYYIQAGYLFPNQKYEVAARHSVISPAVGGASLDETETGVAFSYYFVGHRHKLQADYRELSFDEDPAQDSTEIRAQLQFAF